MEEIEMECEREMSKMVIWFNELRPITISVGAYVDDIVLILKSKEDFRL